MTPCRCRIPDWDRLHHILGYTHRDFARLLFLSENGGLWKIEKAPHRCPSPRTVFILRMYLQLPDHAERLYRANYPHPYPEDLGVGILRHVETKKCQVCGVPFADHSRCRACGGQLTGPKHLPCRCEIEGRDRKSERAARDHARAIG